MILLSRGKLDVLTRRNSGSEYLKKVQRLTTGAALINPFINETSESLLDDHDALRAQPKVR